MWPNDTAVLEYCTPIEKPYKSIALTVFAKILPYKFIAGLHKFLFVEYSIICIILIHDFYTDVFYSWVCVCIVYLARA